MLKDAKYLFAYVAPLMAFIAIYFGGFWSWAGLVFAFVIIPTLEFFTPKSTQNFSEPEEQSRLANLYFDAILYLNLPIHFALVWFYFSTIQAGGLELYEIMGMTASVGIIVGTIGINVAHEMGHRSKKYEQWMSKALLMTALYMHFFIEHNRGHHKYVATERDPATSRFGETIYAFWIRSTWQSYWSAWNLEIERLRKNNLPAFSLNNQMIWYHFIQIAYLLSIGLVFGGQMIGFAIAIAIIGILLLESVNYIEHYGMLRNKLPNGRYEKVLPKHSWNSNHELGRVFLYELTRHSDHHFKASRKYQVLRHFDESPQLPVGYPASIIMALVPPIWFSVMNWRVKEAREGGVLINN